VVGLTFKHFSKSEHPNCMRIFEYPSGYDFTIKINCYACAAFNHFRRYYYIRGRLHRKRSLGHVTISSASIISRPLCIKEVASHVDLRFHRVSAPLIESLQYSLNIWRSGRSPLSVPNLHSLRGKFNALLSSADFIAARANRALPVKSH
jgi:hypothetical protein